MRSIDVEGHRVVALWALVAITCMAVGWTVAHVMAHGF